nr:toxin-like protein 14 isoform X3 [Parasteatoda tepidariorum]
MYRCSIILLCLGITLLFKNSEGAVGFEPLDTSDGNCHSDTFGTIKVGETGYADDCVRGYCSKTGVSIATCGYIKGCDTTVRPPGNYPDCCPQPGEGCKNFFMVG